MDLQSSLKHIDKAYDPETMKLLNFAGFILPTEDYITKIVNFPGANKTWRWPGEGRFFMNFNFFQASGKYLGRLCSQSTDENGHFNLDFDDFNGLFSEPIDGLVLTEFYHPKTLPVDLYISHIHRKSGAYIAYPAGPFMGDTIYVEAHATELDNTLFWPGVVNNDVTETSLIVANPFKVSFMCQISLYLSDSKRAQSDVIKVPPRRVKRFRLEELFPEHCAEIARSKGDYSICIAAQTTVCAYVQIRERETGIVTAIDHLHKYAFH